MVISDLQLLQWYSRRRDIRRNPLPYSFVRDAVMDLLANRETTVTTGPNTQLLITPAIDEEGTIVTLPTIPTTATPPRTARIPIPPADNLRRRGTRDRTQQVFYKPHDIRLVSNQIRTIMERHNPPPAIFPSDNDTTDPTDTDIMREYAIDTLFASE